MVTIRELHGSEPVDQLGNYYRRSLFIDPADSIPYAPVHCKHKPSEGRFVVILPFEQLTNRFYLFACCGCWRLLEDVEDYRYRHAFRVVNSAETG
jgi:hypothetical protein